MYSRGVALSSRSRPFAEVGPVADLSAARLAWAAGIAYNMRRQRPEARSPALRCGDAPAAQWVRTPALILLVDDDPHITAFLTEALSRDGYKVMQAKDGVEAYDHVRRPDCKLMLLDLKMPRINGIELLAMKHDNLAVPTIVMTGLEDVDEEVIREFPGVISFLRKPFTIQELDRAVRDALARGKRK
jgi:CheY-like chemotaxis protein